LLGDCFYDAKNFKICYDIIN